MDVLFGVLLVAALIALACMAEAHERRCKREIAYNERRIRHINFELCQLFRDGISDDPYTAMDRAAGEADRREGTL